MFKCSWSQNKAKKLKINKRWYPHLSRINSISNKLWRNYKISSQPIKPISIFLNAISREKRPKLIQNSWTATTSSAQKIKLPLCFERYTSTLKSYFFSTSNFNRNTPKWSSCSTRSHSMNQCWCWWICRHSLPKTEESITKEQSIKILRSFRSSSANTKMRSLTSIMIRTEDSTKTRSQRQNYRKGEFSTTNSSKSMEKSHLPKITKSSRKLPMWWILNAMTQYARMRRHARTR